MQASSVAAQDNLSKKIQNNVEGWAFAASSTPRLLKASSEAQAQRRMEQRQRRGPPM
jgi:hypothetical protein